MNRTLTLLGLGLTAVAIAYITSTSATAQAPTPIPNVWLQNATPGTAQIGNANVSGTVKAGQFVGGGAGLTGISASSISGGLLNLLGTLAGDGVIKGGNNSANGMGIVGYATSSSGHTGVWGQCAGTNGRGVTAWATSTTGATNAVFAQADSTSGIGVTAWAPASSGSTYGVWGQSNSETGIGVYGFASASFGSSRGVYGRSDGYGVGRGVYGESTNNGTGVYGKCTSASGGSGVVGAVTDSSAYGVYALGNSGASGTKSFRIDHPFDPLNRYLLHYCQEGPEPKNVYDGTVITDESGQAIVALPDYFEEINRHPRIQLTVDDTSDDFVMVKSVGGVKNASFLIRTSKPRVKVFWEVKATRNDKWVQKNGAPVEREKRAGERGKYQHPELYGAPESMGMNYEMSKAAKTYSKTRS